MPETATALPATSEVIDRDLSAEIRQLYTKLIERNPRDAVEALADYPDEFVAGVLVLLNPAVRQHVLDALPRHRRELILAAASPENRRQWLANDQYPEGSVGRLMEPALAIFPATDTIAQATERLRALTRRAFITYPYVVDQHERLIGVVVMRDMMLGRPDAPLESIMYPRPFALRPEQNLIEAMRETMLRHYPVYPVVDAQERLIGLVRGQMLFEQQAVELSAQAGAMVGVQEEERLSTNWQRSLRFRHPWLQVNLLTTFLAAAVVGGFEHTIASTAVLAAFVPVMISQCANVGCQALAISLRGITLGELLPGRAKLLALKEVWLGLLNGFLTGLTAGVGMYASARWSGQPNALMLAVVVVLALTFSCVVAGLVGALTPVGLKRFGFDPATASSIVLTTITDLVSVAALLALAAWLVTSH